MKVDKINLDEIKKKVEDGISEDNPCHDYTKDCMREAIRQALELAAQRAEAKHVYPWTHNKPFVDKQSILDIIERVE